MIDQMLESRAGNRRRNSRKLRDGTGPIGLTQSPSPVGSLASP